MSHDITPNRYRDAESFYSQALCVSKISCVGKA